ncbi:MAG: NTP transferase domain-containing protein, partial [Candidatus Omnitrophica bacterium]|nr:NTP transferase domain-containing protein [Candidatus Omnitrophota bacterium]
MKNMKALILAAGRGTRMKSQLPKVMHEILGRPMILYVIESLQAAGIEEIITIAGYGSDLLRQAARPTQIVVQDELLGSADAVSTAKKALGKFSGDLLIICGDTPLIRYQT